MTSGIFGFSFSFLPPPSTRCSGAFAGQKPRMRQQWTLRDRRSSETTWKRRVRRQKTRRERPKKSLDGGRELPFVFFVSPPAFFLCSLFCTTHYAAFSGHVCLFAEPTNLRFGRDFAEISKRIETRELSTRSKEWDNVLKLWQFKSQNPKRRNRQMWRWKI